jgi:hypothetical protein
MNAQDVIVAGLRAESRILSTESLHMLAEIALTALTAAGYAVVELPEPDEEDDDGQHADHLAEQVRAELAAEAVSDE